MTGELELSPVPKMVVPIYTMGETIVARMINEMRMDFINLCTSQCLALRTLCDENFIKNERAIAHPEVPLSPISGIGFDGASRVDLVLRLRKDLGVPFEIKLGKTRLSKSRIDDEWLEPCKRSHEGTRFKGNMMAILERKFSPPTNDVSLFAEIGGAKVLLTKSWFIISHSKIIDSWKRKDKPDFSSNVCFLAFDEIVEKYGGKNCFNEMVENLLKFDYYKKWVEDNTL